MRQFIYAMTDWRTFTTWGLFAGFVYLKLAEHVDWSWWIVTVPLWGSVIIAMVVGELRSRRG